VDLKFSPGSAIMLVAGKVIKLGENELYVTA